SSLAYAINWAQTDGRMRSTPLSPADNPIEAADRLLDKLSKAELERGETLDDIKSHIRQQAFSAIAPLLTRRERKKFELHERGKGVHPLDLSDDANWAQLRNVCADLGIRWSDKAQAYVAANR